MGGSRCGSDPRSIFVHGGGGRHVHVPVDDRDDRCRSQATVTTGMALAPSKGASALAWKELTATPGWSGRPGEPWRICGVFAPDREVQIVMYLPDTDLMWWMDDVPTVVRTDADGRFCWEGFFPTQMMDAMTQEIVPIEPGSYDVVARHSTTGQDFARARVRILAPEP